MPCPSVVGTMAVCICSPSVDAITFSSLLKWPTFPRGVIKVLSHLNCWKSCFESIMYSSLISKENTWDYTIFSMENSAWNQLFFWLMYSQVAVTQEECQPFIFLFPLWKYQAAWHHCYLSLLWNKWRRKDVKQINSSTFKNGISTPVKNMIMGKLQEPQ